MSHRGSSLFGSWSGSMLVRVDKFPTPIEARVTHLGSSSLASYADANGGRNVYRLKYPVATGPGFALGPFFHRIRLRD